MTNEEAIKILDQLKYPFPSYPKDAEVNEAVDRAIEALKDETQKDNDLCETCRYGDTCGQSDKGLSFAKHSKCWKYRYEEADNDSRELEK